MQLGELAKQSLNELRDIYSISKRGSLKNSKLDSKQLNLLDGLQTAGLAVIPGFIPIEICDSIRREIDQNLIDHAQFIKTSPDGADKRMFGFDKISSIAKEYGFHKYLMEVIAEYEGCENYVGTILAARLDAVNGNIGSGQGWHRDSAPYKQTKLIIYLSDVDDGNGPFEYILASHRRRSVLSGVIKGGFKCNQYRFSDSEINSYISAIHPVVNRITGKAGTAVLVDTRGLHRGSPIMHGSRYALTSYLWFGREMPDHIKSCIIPVKQVPSI